MTEKINSILEEIFPYEKISSETALIEEGILDSLSIMVLIDELENVFHIEIPLEKLEIKDFYTVKAIENLIAKYKKR